MKPDATTLQFCAELGVVFEYHVNNEEHQPDTVWFWMDNTDDGEPDLVLIVEPDGGYTYKYSLLEAELSTELPAHYEDERALRVMLGFVHNELNSKES